jgi:hypothetical protein
MDEFKTHQEYKCWNCLGNTLIPHPRAITKKHPYPDWSFNCIVCKDFSGTNVGNLYENLVCCDCKIGTPDWWYSLGELWDDVWICKYCYDDVIFCQSCYSGHTDTTEHLANKAEYKEKERGDLIEIYRNLRNKKDKERENEKGDHTKTKSVSVLGNLESCTSFEKMVNNNVDHKVLTEIQMGICSNQLVPAAERPGLASRGPSPCIDSVIIHNDISQIVSSHDDIAHILESLESKEGTKKRKLEENDEKGDNKTKEPPLKKMKIIEGGEDEV